MASSESFSATELTKDTDKWLQQAVEERDRSDTSTFHFLPPLHSPPPPLFFFFFLTKFSRENFQEGLRRIDAALDALRPMDFAEDLVRSTVSELLEVSVFNYSFGC